MFSRYLGYNVFQRPPSKADGNVVLQFAKLMQFILNGGSWLSTFAPIQFIDV